jgi:hypothetical protein
MPYYTSSRLRTGQVITEEDRCCNQFTISCSSVHSFKPNEMLHAQKEKTFGGKEDLVKMVHFIDHHKAEHMTTRNTW